MKSKTETSINPLVLFSIIIYLVYAFFSDMIGVLFPAAIYRYSLWGISTVIMLVFNGNIIKQKIDKRATLIVFFILSFVIVRNQAFSHNDYMTTLRWLYCFVFCLLLIRIPGSYGCFLKILCAIGFIHVFATLIFWVIPSLYSKMYLIWGYWPSGTSYGTMGYKAALTNHYSRNGIMLAITCLALFSIVLSRSEISSQNNKKNLFKLKTLFVIAIFATILTTKRAHFLFSTMAMFLVYYLCNPQKSKSRAFKIVLSLMMCAFVLSLTIQFVPAIDAMFSRFSSVEEDSTMQSRFVFWDLALRMFSQHPILGNGWFAYRYQYNIELYDTTVRSARYTLLDCHNVYIQLLAETGVIGLTLFLLLVTAALYNTIYNIRRHHDILDNKKLYVPLLFSASMQVFFLLYCLTGNCLYDITSAFYFIAIAFSIGINRIIKDTIAKGFLSNESRRKTG